MAFDGKIAFGNGTLECVQRSILELRKLPVGWHYGSGRQVEQTAIVSALVITAELHRIGARRLESFPTINGGVLVSAYRDEETIDVLCRADNLIDIYHEEGGTEFIDDYGLSPDEAQTYIRDLEWQTTSSGSYTHGITVMSGTALRAWPSSIPMTDSLFSTPTVRYPQVAVSVNTAEDSIRRSREIHQYSFDLKSRTFQLEAA